MHPLYRRTPRKTDSSFQCEERQQEKPHGKTQMKRRNTHFHIFALFLKRDLALGVTLDPGFSWKAYFMLKYDASLKP